MIAITGATGQLGRLVVEGLLASQPASSIVAIVRDPAKATAWAARGVQVRQGDYTQPAALAQALQGVDKLLLISSSEVGQRTAQHRNVIDAARQAGVKLVAYTSILRADSSPLGLAREHRETEALLRGSGLSHVLLRNGWYTENYTASAPAAVQHGAVLGSAGTGRYSFAARADYAAAAVAVLTQEGQAGRVYELAGDQAYTLADYAAEIARLSGKPVAYQNLPEAEYAKALVQIGLPDFVAAMLAESDVGASKGALFDEGRALSRLIGRPTTPVAESIKAALKG
ncbi:SDR family NAD(P)-dependent oxidoreductase [Hylemonella gracilis]|uniref:SDR family NAD(P)-dependent oxidoreductase n=1 Tax=Hylemonella gracilis TaxID=80880 RepID=A0A4P6UIS2_9BURK|nr:SDR family oxidoreductase [Hylemonella gracilis]QBK05012.1 SDR family NAD(P)-dependent oxidoreductase [Hylemonella gracilis]